MADAVWRKSSYSSDTANCVEVAQVPGGLLVRDSKNPTGPALSCGLDAWREFIADIRLGLFDRSAPAEQACDGEGGAAEQR